MMNQGIMEAQRDGAVENSVAVDAQSVKAFFSSVCAAGYVSTLPAVRQ
jgi:hypothetical protein